LIFVVIMLFIVEKLCCWCYTWSVMPGCGIWWALKCLCLPFCMHFLCCLSL
jgi:hypothetical protein